MNANLNRLVAWATISLKAQEHGASTLRLVRPGEKRPIKSSRAREWANAAEEQIARKRTAKCQWCPDQKANPLSYCSVCENLGKITVELESVVLVVEDIACIQCRDKIIEAAKDRYQI